MVASKIHFTNSAKDMEEYISHDRLLKEMDGGEDWEYKYLEPVPGENDKMKDTTTRDRMLAAREELVKQYEEATRQWIKEPHSEKGAKAKAERNSIAAKLKADYWALDPYIRARSLYDRIGMILPTGTLNYYPQAPKVLAAVNGTTEAGSMAAVETSVDDVD